MARTYTALTGGGAGSAYQSGDKWGYQTAENVRQALDLLAYLGAGYDLGGTETDGKITGAATWVPVYGYKQFTLNGDNLGGLTLDLVVYSMTSNAATSVQARLRNVTDGSNAAISAAHAGTTATEETVTVTLASGAKVYRLEMLGDATNAVMAWGYVRFRKVPA